MMYQNRVFAALIWVMILPSMVFAHGTDYRLVENDVVVVAEFFYSDKTPMQYAEILVFSPENDKVEFQNGRTDASGRFAFFAEIPGDWRLEVNDGMGHAVQATIGVTSPEPEKDLTGELSGEAQNTASRQTAGKKKNALFGNAAMGVKLFLGLSILLNLFLGMYVWKRKN